jgi:hypothetical protein
MTSMPTAITLLLPVITADAGQGRADTLLGILAAGPDHVRQHLGAIDSALGAQSPGLPTLIALIDKAEEAVSASRPTVRHQHVISQVVLRRFLEVLPAGKRLTRVNLATGQVELITTNAAGWVRDFVPVDSKATEDLWQQVETRLNPAMDAALGGTALGNPAHLETLKDAVALHFIRNPQTLQVHNKSFADALDRRIDAIAKTPLAAEAFRRKYHLAPAGAGDLRLGAEAFHEPMVTLHREGGLFRLSVQRLYEKVCVRFDSRGVEILTPASANKEFLIGDSPAITLKQSTGEFGISQGITVDEADEIFMPLTPRLLVVVGPPDAARALPDDEVDAYNKMQAREAKDYVIRRPSANFAASIAAWRT